MIAASGVRGQLRGAPLSVDSALDVPPLPAQGSASDETGPVNETSPTAGNVQSPPPALRTIVSNGDSANRVDIIFLGDGYTSSEIATTYTTDIQSYLSYIFGDSALTQPFGRYEKFFNVYAVDVVSNESGADDPEAGIVRDTALDASYKWDGVTDRLLYISDSKALAAMDAALNGTGIGDDMRYVTVNNSKYGGGGGIFGVYAGGNSSAHEVALHEIGHSFAGLADEYGGDPGTYSGGEPPQIDVTTDPAGTKWAKWLGYNDPILGAVGTYEGGVYFDHGVYRPTDNSKMRSLDRPFDPIAREQFIRRFYTFVDPLDGHDDNVGPKYGVTTLNVDTIDPAVISVDWTVNAQTFVNKGEAFDLSSAGFGPGIYTVTGRAYDATDWVRGDRSDLEQSVTWTVVRQAADAVTLSPTWIGDVDDTGVFRLDLGATGLSTIQSITIRDDNVVSGGTGGASGFDLDFVELSNTDTMSAPDAVGLLPGMNVFDFSDSAVLFQGGLLQALQPGDPSFWDTTQLFGTTGNQHYSQSLATLSARDGSNTSSAGEISLGEGGYITFNLAAPVSTAGLFLYLGDVGGANDISYVTVRSGTVSTQPQGTTLLGTPGDDDLRLGIGKNVHLGAGPDRLDGGAGNDQIGGGPGNDFLAGGTGNDTLGGGAGNDVLNAAAGNDAVDGGGGLDALVYSWSQSSCSILRSGATCTITTPDGTDTLTNVERAVFQDRTTSIRLAQSGDFSSDGVEDLLWQNTSGQASIWLMNGATKVSAANVGANPGSTWHEKSRGDFDGDGVADILWQNTNGQASIWLMNGLTKVSAANAGTNPGTTWQVIVGGDFNGDNKADILWQNTSGQAAVWLMNGTTKVSAANVGSNPGTAWHEKTTGDFNGDGMADILWQNDSGQASIWLMNGLTKVSAANAGTNPGSAWQVKGTGDFDGDGQADILWQNTNGQAAIWLMNGVTKVSAATIGTNPGTAWHVIGGEDLDNDGRSDIVWQNTNGQASAWFMNGLTRLSAANVGSNPGTAWHLVGAVA